MADEQIPQDVDANIDASLGDDRPKKRTRKAKAPSYQVIGDSKIPVSAATGKVWKSRLSMAQKATSGVARSWNEAIRYYNNDQLGHREHYRDRECRICQCYYYGTCFVF
jgi:hypothetical protein